MSLRIPLPTNAHIVLTVDAHIQRADEVYKDVPVLRVLGQLAEFFILLSDHDHFGSIENVIRTNRLAHKKYSKRMVVRMTLKIVSQS